MMQLNEPRTPSPFSLFNLGFRPFFLGGALAAAILIICWLVVYSQGVQIPYYNYSIYWHAHEMIFGYTLAIIAGFLLTAVRNWTSRETISGYPLAALFALWLTARILPLFESIPALLISITDLAFTPLLALIIALPIIQSRNYRNLIFILLILLFFVANLLVHLELLNITNDTAYTGLYLALFLVVMVMTIIGGRVIPFFTERGVSGVKCTKYAWLEKAIIPLTAIWLLASLSPFPELIAIAGLITGIAHLVRLQGWFDTAILNNPLVWVLHAGYLFMSVGFLLQALSHLELISKAVALHAFAVGGIGTLTLGMMARVSLGHTGRPLMVNSIMITAFVLMVLSVLVRLSPGLFPVPYLATLHLSGTLWALAWILFIIRYSLILIRPRTDGLFG